MKSDAGVALAQKIAFLQCAESYPDATASVLSVETHRSWVFLTARYAYKLKKPGLHPLTDASTAAARKFLCDEELRLNRRLAGDVYIAVVPLTLNGPGRLQLEGDGTAVDWLVKMQRLPAECMLDARIRAREVPQQGIARAAQKLARFYRQAPPLALSAAEYRLGLEMAVRSNRDELVRPLFALSDETVRAVCAIQTGFLAREAALFERRIGQGRVVEAHGDLRPEHVCLIEPEPLIIDCLEFSLHLRTLDAAAELAFLDQECERLDAAWVGEILFGVYGDITHDRPPQPLLRFYRSHWACVRAKLCAWHLLDPDCREPAGWSLRAADYLRRAERYALSI